MQTDRGKVIMTGDTVYDIPMQLEDKMVPGVMWPSGNVYNTALLQDSLYRLKCELKNGTALCPSHGYEPFDRFKFGQKRSDKCRNYEGWPEYKWPPVGSPKGQVAWARLRPSPSNLNAWLRISCLAGISAEYQRRLGR